MTGRPRVLLTDHAWPGTEVEAGLCDAAGYDLVEAPPGTAEDVLAGLAADVDGILTCWAQVTAKVIAASPSLRVVSRMGIGLDNIDLAAAAARRVAVTRVPDYCVEEVSDHVVGLLHAWARCILTADRDVRAGVWDPGRYAPRRVSSLVTGVWGLGPTGRRTAEKLAALGCRVLADDRHPELAPAGVEAVPAGVLLAECDVLSLHLPLTPATRDGRRPLLPVPMVNIVSGNLHAAGGMDIQDVLVIPAGAGSTAEALEWVHDVYHAAGDLLRARGASVLIGDEGGYGAPALDSEQVIALVTEAIKTTNRQATNGVGVALDVAATHLVRADGRYDLDGREYSAAELGELLAGWVARYPILSVEDPFGEDDWAAWQAFAARCPDLQLVGDDLIATHLDRLRAAARAGAANAVLTKVNQIGTVTEALQVADEAAALGMRAVISARSGETEDDWLADLAVASGAGQIKVGSVARSERLAKYNRLLRIERSAQAPPYAGLLPFSPPDQGAEHREPGSRS